jgi:putative ABC transport system permease protein
MTLFADASAESGRNHESTTESEFPMTFVALIVKNLFRQRVRTALTILGISIGITTVVALGVVTEGMKSTLGDMTQFGGSDFLVGQKGSADLTFSTITEDEWRGIAARDDVEWAHGVLLHVARVGSNPYFVLSGILPEHLAESPPNLTSGSLLTGTAGDEMLLGASAADDLGLAAGDQLTIDDLTFSVAGIYRTGITLYDNGGYAPLQTVRELASKPSVVTMIYVRLAAGATVAATTASIEADMPSVVTIRSASDFGEVDQGMQIIDAMDLAISALAVGIGAIGVMNTMVMSVYERTREIGILRAVGWTGGRILRMIVTESLLLCCVAMVAGLFFGYLAVQALMTNATIGAFLEPTYTPGVVLRALVVAVAVALSGAIYPAVRAVRLTPMEALRHE